jgi:multiple sugar transport system permease protein
MSPARRRWGLPSEVRTAWLFLLPALALLIAVRLVPIVISIWGSFVEPGRGGQEPTIGLGNYEFMFSYPTFYRSVATTITLVLVAVTLQTTLALGLAVLFVHRIKGAGVMRTILLMPLVVPIAASATLWQVLFLPEGPINAVLASVGIPPQPFLLSPDQALYCIILILTWSVTGYWMTVLAAGLHDIPIELYEAASIDGAHARTAFRRITLPLMRRPLLFVIVAATVANFLAFAPTQILTKGGPRESTNVIMYEIFSQSYTNNDTGLASAEITVVLVILGALVALQFRLLGRVDH